jgi:cell division protein FtsI/penicillin-binding protein 2
LTRIRITIFFLLLVIAAFLSLIARCFYLQYYNGSHYNDVSISQQKALVNWQSQRGSILDSRGRVLAASNRVDTIFVEPRNILDVKDISSALAEVVNIPADEICRMIIEGQNPGFVKIKSDATFDETDKARKIRGVGVQSNWQRHYPLGRLTSSIVGFTSIDNRGIEGIELKYDANLCGTSMQNIFFADVKRRPIRLKEQNGVLNDGVGIILTIDSTIQQFVRDELSKQLEAFEAESAVSVVADPKTGAILAMVSIPDYDPMNRSNEDVNNFRTRVITDWYEPGSIIKPIITAIAVDAGAINKNDVIYCENGNYHGKGFGSIKEYSDGFGNLSVKEILVKSSNIGMAKIGQKVGRQKLYEGLKLFGFGSPTGIELPGEIGGLLRPVDEWTGYSVTRIPFGQEICVTAMQLVRGFCILANGGRLVNPYLVKAIVDNNGEIIQARHPAAPVGYLIKREVADWIVQDCLVGVVNEGTGTRAKLKKWQVFGKTGSANIALADDRGYSEDNYIASFICGAPAEDPQIVVLVSIRKPNKKLKKGYTGGVVASPVAAAIVEKTLTYLEGR